MTIIYWIIFGAIAGWIASMIMKSNSSQGLVMDIVMGIIGAVVGGFIMEFFGKSGVTGFNLYSLVVAVIGASVVIYRQDAKNSKISYFRDIFLLL